MKKLLSTAVLFFVAVKALADSPIILETPIILPSPPCVHYAPHPCPQRFPIEPYCVEPPKPSHNYLGGLYITGQYAYSSNHIRDIENVSAPGAGTPDTVKGSLTERSSSPNIAVGYQLWNYPFISPRIEVAYLPRMDLEYNANPFLQGLDSSINSSIDSHTVLFKLYNDFEFYDFPLIPYVEGGIGKVWTEINSNSTVDLFPGIIPPFVGTGNNQRTSRAWDLGFGARYRFYRSLFLNVGYEYVSLGDNLKWNINYTNPIITLPVFVNLKSGKFNSQTLFAGITWQPFVLLN